MLSQQFNRGPILKSCVALGVVLLLVVGCGKPVESRPMELETSGIPQIEPLLETLKSVVKSARDGKLKSLDAGDQTLTSMVTRAVLRRDGFADAIARQDSGEPRVLLAQRQLIVVLKETTKFDRQKVHWARLVMRDGKWTLVDTSIFEPLEDFLEVGRPYKGDDLLDVAKQISAAQGRPDDMSLFAFQELDGYLNAPLELPEDWDGKITQARESWNLAIELPAKYDDPNRVGVVLFKDYSSGREVETEGYWQSRGTLVDNRIYFNPDLGPILNAEGKQEASQKTASAIRDLFRIGDITQACQKLAAASDNESALPYLDAARLSSISRGDSEQQIVELAHQIDPDFQFDASLGFDR